jgi:hypothetical protein
MTPGRRISHHVSTLCADVAAGPGSDKQDNLVILGGSVW